MSEGSAVLSYDIFLNLEVADGQDLFRSDANGVRYGLIPEAASAFNPDGLPIGISKTTIGTSNASIKFTTFGLAGSLTR